MGQKCSIWVHVEAVGPSMFMCVCIYLFLELTL